MTSRSVIGGLVVAVVASALGVVYSSHVVRELYSRQQLVEYGQWELQEDYSRLLLEQSTLASPHRIISIAQEDLAMTAPALSAERVVYELGGGLR